MIATSTCNNNSNNNSGSGATILPLNGSSPGSDLRNGSKRGSNENLNSFDPPSTMTSSASVTSLASSAAAKLSNGHANGNAVNGDLDYMEKVDSGGDDKKLGKASNPGPARDASKRSRDSSKMTKEDQVVKLESELKKLKVDLQVARNKENELRDQIVSAAASKFSQVLCFRGGLHSTEVAYLLLAQQPLVCFSALPTIFLL